MSTKTVSPGLLPLLRECKRLDTKRANSALTADEHARWLELKDRLGARLAPSERARRASARVETRIAACFETPEDFQEAVISNLSLGGVFISTASPSEIGTKLTLSLRVTSTGTKLDLSCVVVSENVGAAFDTSSLGMGLKFLSLSAAQRKVVEKLYAQALPAPPESKKPASS